MYGTSGILRDGMGWAKGDGGYYGICALDDVHVRWVGTLGAKGKRPLVICSTGSSMQEIDGALRDGRWVYARMHQAQAADTSNPRSTMVGTNMGTIHHPQPRPTSIRYAGRGWPL